MRARLIALERRLLPNGYLDVARQVALFASAYWAYRLVRGAIDGHAAAAFQHARDLIHLERAMHMFVEPSIQYWASGQHWLIDAACWLYLNAQFSVTLGCLVFIYLFHNQSFYFVRNMFMVAMALALIGYIAFPTAPPRFLPEWGFTDSVANFTHVSNQDVAVNALFNPYAAVPSMHVAFALMLGIPLARLVRNRLARIFWTSYPLLVVFAVVATGNHFWLDAFLGALVAAASAFVADRGLARVRPGAWGFGEEAKVGAAA